MTRSRHTHHPGDSPLRLLEQDTLACSRAIDAELAERDLDRLRSESLEAGRIVDGLAARGMRVGFDLGPRGIEIAIRDDGGAMVLRLRPADVVDLQRLRELLAQLSGDERPA